MDGFLTEGQIAQLILLIGAVSAAAVAIIRELRASRNATTAAAVVTAAQQNRYLETRGAEPVTAASPPMSTGSGGVDKAVTEILTTAAPATSSQGVPAPTNADLQRSLDAAVERIDALTAAIERISPA